MKKSILLAVVLLLSGCQERKASFIKRFDSQNDMQTTISKLKEQQPKHGLVVTMDYEAGK
jgi:predicted DNA-binding WGR domain protein